MKSTDGKILTPVCLPVLLGVWSLISGLGIIQVMGRDCSGWIRGVFLLAMATGAVLIGVLTRLLGQTQQALQGQQQACRQIQHHWSHDVAEAEARIERVTEQTRSLESQLHHQQGLIDEQSHDHRQLTEDLQFYRYGLDHCTEAILWIGSRGEFLYVNEAACRQLEYSREELMDLTWLDIVTGMSIEDWQEHWTANQSRGGHHLSVQIKGKGERIFPADLNLVYLECRPQAYYGVSMQDTTYLQRAHRQLSENMNQMRYSIEEWKRFVHFLCQELRFSLEQIPRHMDRLKLDLQGDSEGQAYEHVQAIDGLIKQTHDILHTCWRQSCGEFPRDHPQMSCRVVHPSNSEGAGRSKILLVEDNPGDAYLMKIVLEEASLPYELEILQNGEKALQYLHQSGPYQKATLPSLILLDLHLPRIDGFTVLEIIKTDPDLQFIPVVVLSTSDAPKDKAKAFGLQADDYLVKPIDANKLKTTLRDMNRLIGKEV